jgi:hypothetical protein
VLTRAYPISRFAGFVLRLIYDETKCLIFRRQGASSYFLSYATRGGWLALLLQVAEDRFWKILVFDAPATNLFTTVKPFGASRRWREKTMDIVHAIAAGTKALEVLRAIRDINKAYDDASWKSKVAELMSDIADMKMALFEANDQMRALQTDNDKLAKQVRFKAEKTIYEKGLYYEVYDDGQIAELPFCQSCMTKGEFIRLVYGPIDVSRSYCPGCKTHYNSSAMTREALHRERGF